MELAIYNTSGADTGKKAKLNDAVFGIEPNEHAVYLDVKQFLAHQRQGTHKSKERNEITGSTRKIKRQKGTGTARAGSIKNPLFKGGGRVFGPQPRSYQVNLNKKVKKLARKSALSSAAKSEGITVVEDFTMAAPKTSEYLQILGNLKVDDKKTLLVLAESNNNVYLSARNLPGVKVVTASDLNTYDILNADSLLLCASSVEKIENLLS